MSGTASIHGGLMDLTLLFPFLQHLMEPTFSQYMLVLMSELFSYERDWVGEVAYRN